MSFEDLNDEERHVHVWIQAIAAEFINFYKYSNKNYLKICEKIVIPLQAAWSGATWSGEQYETMIRLCEKGSSQIKQINGNHYHIYLLQELIKMIKKILEPEPEKMQIFHLKLDFSLYHPYYEEDYEHVIIAKNEQEARQMAQRRANEFGEPGKVWLDENICKIINIGISNEKESRIVCTADMGA